MRVRCLSVTVLCILIALTVAWHSTTATAQEARKSLYLVTAEYLDPGPLLPREQVAGVIEGAVIPSLEALAKLEAEKRIVGGGILAGARAGVFLVEAASNEEVARLVHGLPFWGLLKWDITPLERFAHRAALDRESLQQLKAPKP